MTNSPNIDIFNETVGKALAHLYECFPKKVGLDIFKLMNLPQANFDDENYLSQIETNEIYYFSLEWLVDSGYVSGSPQRYDGIRDAVLTSRGLEILKFKPDFLNDAFGAELLSASKAGAADVLKRTASSLLTTALTLAIKGIIGHH